MTWTTEAKVRSLLRLPWTVTSEPADDPGEFVVRVAELPGMIVIGTSKAIDAEFWDALRATLEAYVEEGGPIPLPGGQRTLPWDNSMPRARVKSMGVLVADKGDAWDVVEAKATTALSEGVQGPIADNTIE